MDNLAGSAYLIPFTIIFFWVGFGLSQLIIKTKLSGKDILLSLVISWIVSSIPQLFLGTEIYKTINEAIIVCVVSFFISIIMRNKAKNNELNQYVNLINNNSNEVKRIKIGFDWPCCLFGFFFGVPLFLKKLNSWGGVITGIVILYVLLNTSESSHARNAAFVIFLVIIGFSIFLGFKANEMAAKQLIDNGWKFKEGEDSNVALASEKWNINRKEKNEL
ncbi:MAG: hypothetical protein GX625_08345 [Clostridiaceae bacterium]|uniref:Hypothetical membrane protein n=1 Tax=Syntrophus aciditrophicus (strain SB) TaxID=56780 RepID=Q2LV84_SYNAS|nr:hypothetical protein [Syntrophus aciditrophicus]ABC77997.1 hypothetical membrane protein [Syntrophus aciditrophicus SB]NLE25337.1 hypothetical protein [Clostridiaceae bacterium]